MAVVQFHLNGQTFDVEEGTPTFERLTGEGHVPVEVEEAPVKGKSKAKNTDEESAAADPV